MLVEGTKTNLTGDGLTKLIEMLGVGLEVLHLFPKIGLILPIFDSELAVLAMFLFPEDDVFEIEIDAVLGIGVVKDLR